MTRDRRWRSPRSRARAIARLRGPAGARMPPTPVVLASARTTPIEDASEYVASLKSLRSTTIQPQIDGQITRILVTAGERVARVRR